MDSSTPIGWAFISFMDLFDIQGGTQPPKKEFIFKEQKGYVRLLQIRDFGDKPVPTFIPYKKQLKVCNQNDILIGRYGASVGRICTGMEGAYNVALAKVIIPEALPKRFVFFLLHSPDFQRPLIAIERSAQNGFNKEDLAKIQIKVPPLNEQYRIVAKLEKLLAKVNQCKTRLEKIPTILKRFRQAVFAAAFTGQLTKERFLKKTTEPVPLLLERIKEHRLKNSVSIREFNQIKQFYETRKNLNYDIGIELPEHWARCQIGDIGNVCNGSTPSRKVSNYWNGDLAWVSSGEVQNNIINETKEKITDSGYENASVRLLPIGTVLLAMIGEGKTRGQTSILNIPATINQNIAAVLVDHGKIDSEYLWYWFQYQYEENRQVGSGSGPQALNCQRVRDLPFHLPPLEEQKEIVDKVKHLFQQTEAIKLRYLKSLKYLSTLTQSILAKAFRGELVPQDPNDEPASELLKRIQTERAKLETEKPKRRFGQRKPPKTTALQTPSEPTSESPTPSKASQTEPPASDVFPPADTPSRPTLDQADQSDIMASIRQICRTTGPMDPDDLLRQIAQKFGRQRLSTNLKLRLQGHLHAAKIRKIAQAQDGLITLATIKIEDYEPDVLLKAVLAIMPKGRELDETTVYQETIRYLGFKRLTENTKETIAAVLRKANRNGLVTWRQGILCRL